MKTILSNGTIFASAHFQAVEALYIENGRIAAFGSKSEIMLQFCRPDVTVIDLAGAFVYPGFVDNHLHLPGHGMRLSMLDLSVASSKAEMFTLLKKQVQQTPPGEWVLGLNWDENQFPCQSIPNIQELDTLSDNHPIFLTRTCTHAYLANTNAFQRAGIRVGQNDPPNGSFGRDTAGRFNGLLYEQAAKPFYEAQPTPDYEAQKTFTQKAIQHALQLGLTAAHTEDLRYLGRMDALLRIYRELREEGHLFRTNHLIYHPHLPELDDLQLKAGDGDEWLRIGAVKIFADGAIGGRTALLSSPYHDSPQTSGIAMHTQAEFDHLTQQARKRKIPIAVHAIGDGGIEIALRSMERFPAQKASSYRDRLIHVQVIRPEQIERLKQLHVAVDIQPRFVASDFPWVIDRVGPERTDFLYPWKTLIDAGIICGGGSDAPIEPLDPLLGIHAAITRRKPKESHAGYLVQQKLNRLEAIRLFTLGGAQTATEEQERGSIEIGKYGDLTVLDRNLFTVDVDKILDAQTKLTIVNGRIAYRNGL
ncbi:hydrolase [Ammoniphilus oxalaticus]|uniref:Hydrolase n=1 Tax=Ammoniphilus oxalaticus TaxID=66863 RepID=A0A419SFQ5_9BACL|nr:amidohydrolase [Ammoniphilus oxalaticus]RKD22621.1 hydrolase [Ammoniphilus oxalaticus]